MKNIFEIEIKLEGKEWTNCLDNSFKKNSKNAKVDGFRKGSVPKDIYLKQYGIESLYNDAIDEALQIAYKKALEDNKEIVPVVEPKVDVTGISDGSVIFKFTFITRPDVKLPDYKKLDVKKDNIKVTKEEINTEIEHLRENLAEVVVKENGTVAEGDTVVIDFDGYVDGKPLDGGKGENYPLEIGSNTFIPGFESGLVGHKTDEELELNLKFPEEYVENLKNKPVTFKVKIHEIKTKVLRELNEEFYLDLGMDNVHNEEELRKEVEKTLKERKEAEVNEKYTNDLVEKLAEGVEVELNPEIVHDEIHQMVHSMEHQLSHNGLNIDAYLKMLNITMDDLEKQMEPEATKRVKIRFALEEIIEKENIDFTTEEVEAKAKEMAENYGITLDELLKAYMSLDYIKYDMKMQKAIEILKGNTK